MRVFNHLLHKEIKTINLNCFSNDAPIHRLNSAATSSPLCKNDITTYATYNTEANRPFIPRRAVGNGIFRAPQ